MYQCPCIPLPTLHTPAYLAYPCLGPEPLTCSPQFMPWPPAGLCTCAASPARNTLPPAPPMNASASRSFTRNSDSQMASSCILMLRRVRCLRPSSMISRVGVWRGSSGVIWGGGGRGGRSTEMNSVLEAYCNRYNSGGLVGLMGGGLGDWWGWGRGGGLEEGRGTAIRTFEGT